MAQADSQAFANTKTQLSAETTLKVDASQSNAVKTSAKSTNMAPIPSLTAVEQQAAIAELRAKHLQLPLDGISVESFKGSFYEQRGGSKHEASDMLAPRNTPIHAVEDGTVAKLFLSRFGGNTIYQFDPSEKFVYYYAHLERYEPSLKEGDRVKKGQIIGYVGTSGNAPPNTPHLHLSISVLTPEKKWWQAASIDPYEVFKSK